MNKVLNILNYFLFLLTIIFFHNSYLTLLLMLIIFILSFLNKKITKKILIYYSFVLLYLVFSYINATFFKSLVPGNFNYSIFLESIYLIKFTIPLLFYELIKDVDFDKKLFKNITILIFLMLFITNIFKISLSSYSNQLIEGNIFDWINNNLNYAQLATKGFFTYANQGALLVSLLSIYFAFKRQNMLVLFNILSGILIATRVSTFLPIMFLILYVMYSFIVDLIKRNIDKVYYAKNIVIILAVLLIIPFSPQLNRIKTYNLYKNSYNIQLVYNSNLYVTNSTDKIDYIKNNYKDKNINENFIIESYPYQYDPEFWYEKLKEPYSKRIDYRYLEIEMVKRVYEVNNNKFDYLFGIGMTRIYNIWNIETDFVMQFYSFGIIGFLLIFFVYLLMLKDYINDFLKNKKFDRLVLMSVFILISYLSGNILNSLPFTLLSIVLINDNRKDKVPCISSAN